MPRLAPGGGKTVTVGSLVCRHLTLPDPPDFLLVDPAKGDYRRMVRALGGQVVATAGVLLALRRRRPWNAARFALAPALLLTATVNWGLLAVGPAAFVLLAWARRRPASWP